MKQARRFVIGALALAAAGSLFAAPAAHGASDPIGGAVVTVDADPSDGSVGVGTGLPGQPLLSARYQNGEVCTGFSYQMPFCVGIGVAS